jgi:hypothetical protein
MSRNTIRRCGVLLVLVLALGLVGATPASAAPAASVETPGWNRVLGWLTGFFDLSHWAVGAGGDKDGGTSGSLSRIWQMEGAGYDPFGLPLPTGEGTPGPSTDEGAGYDPFGSH